MRFLVVLAVFLAANTFAEEKKGFTIYHHLGQTMFDENLDDDNLVGLGVGYRFDSPWAVELTYQQTDADFNAPFTGSSDLKHWNLGALYNLKSQNDFHPFLSFGVARASFDNSRIRDYDDTQYNAGVGVKWNFTEKAAIRGDLKLFPGGSDDVDATVSLGLHYAFGGGKAKAPETVDGDADGDGVPDSVDRCPDTPAGVEVDSQGCPKDDDGDGVPNYRDDCPGTTDRRAKIDARGCYVKLEQKVDITLNVEFDFDSSRAREEHAAEVRKVADFMHQYTNSTVVMEGHTDSQGSDEYNQGLSERRAKTIADMLVQKFDVSAARVSSKGYGESKPIASNDNKADRQRNRRVVAVVEGKKEEIEMK